MPLLKRREFKPAKLPPDLRHTEEVFHCKITNEIFRDYDEFFKRTILCNSLVWSCSLTGKPNLTYQEAVESEERARRYLASFPVYLEAPVLFLASLTRRGNLSDLCDDVFVFARDRYFIGEIVDVTRDGTRETCQVTAVIPPAVNGKGLEESSDDDVILIEDDGNEQVVKSPKLVISTPALNGKAPEESRDDDVMLIEDDGNEQVVKSPKLVISPRMPKPETLNPSLYRYRVMSLQGSGVFEMAPDKLSRKKGLYTREKNKLYLKQHCEVQNHVWAPKPQFKEKFNLEDRTFSEFFAGPQPVFKFTPAKRMKKTVPVPSESDSGTDDDIPLAEVRRKSLEGNEGPVKKKKSPNSEKSKAPRISTEERLRIAEEKAQAKAALKEKMRLEKEQMRVKTALEKAQAKEQMRVQKEQEKAARKEFMKKVFEEEREKKRLLAIQHKEQRDMEKAERKELIKKAFEEEKAKKRQEREALREEREAREKILREWRRPRDDLECDDLKELPWPSPVCSKIPPEIFGNVLMLVEFCHIFGEHLDLEDFPDGVTLDVVEKSLLSKEVDGTLYELLKCLMSAIFKMQDEEEEDEKLDLEEHGVEAPSADLSEALNDDDPTYGALTSAATAATAWPQIHHGTPLRSLPVDSTTISEVLRLHLLSSGAKTTPNNIKWRYQQRGGYTPHDDCGMEFRLQEPAILKELTTGNVYDLSPMSKVKILDTLIGQILTYVALRDVIEESYDTQVNTRKEWKEFNRAERHREREEATARWKQKMEERAKEKEIERQKREQKEKERMEQLKKDEQNINAAVNAFATAVGAPAVNGGAPVSNGPNGVQNPPNQSSTNNVNGTNGEVPAPEPEKELTPEEQEAKRKKEEREAKKAADKARRLEEERLARKEAFEKQEQEYAEQIAEASAKYSIMPLGEDRIFRRFWRLNATPGLYVECDRMRLEDFDFTPVPQNPRSNPLLPMNIIAKPQVTMTTVQQQQAATAQIPFATAQQTMQVDEIKEHDTSNSSNKENIDVEGLGTNSPSLGAAPLSDQTKQEAVVNGVIPEPDVKIITPDPPDLCMTRKNHTRWAYFNTTEQIDQLIASLNPRGFRESTLKEILLQERKKIEASIPKTPVEFLTAADDSLADGPHMASTPRQVVVKMNSGKKGLVSDRADGEESLELLLREQVLYIEDRVWQGGLGYIKVKNRNRWIEAIEQGAYDRQSDTISWGPVWARSLLDDKDFLNMSGSDLPLADDEKMPSLKPKDRVSELKKSEGSASGSPASTRCSTPTSNLVEQVVRDMACALLQVSQGVEDKYLKEPLGKEDPTAGVRKSKRQSTKKGDESDSDDDVQEVDDDEKKPRKNTRECWEESLMASTSLSQVFLHLNTLERSIIWARSLLNLRCKICRRKGEAEAMLLCDGCDRGYHMYCLKPALKCVPRGDWYCKDCKSKKQQQPRTPRKKRRPTFDSEEEEKEEAQESESSEDEEEEEEEEASEEEEEESEEEESEEEEEEEEEEAELEVESDGDDVEDDDAEVNVSAVSHYDGDHDDVCEGCRHGGQLLLCDQCPTAFHKECLDPPLSKVPPGAWICPICDAQANGSYEDDDHEDLCAKCNHGGELICCDKCPLAYHLECCEPPLHKVPKGDWKCEECEPKRKKKSQAGKPNAKDSPSSTKPSKASKKSPASTSSKTSSNRTIKGSKQTPPSRTNKSRSRQRTPDTDDDAPAPKKRATRRPGSVAASSEEDSATETPVQECPQKRNLSKKSSAKSSRSASSDDGERAKKPARGGIKVLLEGSRRSRDSRSQSTDESETEGSGPSRRRISAGGRGSQEGHQVNLCEDLLRELVKHPDSGPFRLPVSKKAVPDYHILIKRPMDFATMQTKFQHVEYQTPMEFIADCRLIFTNCQQYNVSSSYEAKCGRRLASFFSKRLKALGIQEVAPSPKADNKDDGEQPKKRPRRL